VQALPGAGAAGRGRGRGRDRTEAVSAISGPFALGPAAMVGGRSTRGIIHAVDNNSRNESSRIIAYS
jgi:hypothetical protein